MTRIVEEHRCNELQPRTWRDQSINRSGLGRLTNEAWGLRTRSDAFRLRWNASDLDSDAFRLGNSADLDSEFQGVRTV